jgi:uncharacterized protein (DUF1501 family)
MAETHTPSRRDFLEIALGGTVALAVPGSATASMVRNPVRSNAAKCCVFINLVGGPSQLDTFDPKPDAPAEVRGPFQPIRTAVPGVLLSESFPRLARMTNRFSLIRSMTHAAPPIHECGFQLLNTGRLFRDGPEWPNVGAVAAHLLARPDDAWWICPHARIDTGVSISHGLGAGFLDGVKARTLPHRDGQSWDLRSLTHDVMAALRHGARFVAVNMFDSVFDALSWDCHADGGSLRTDMSDIRNHVAPLFDMAFSGLLEHLDGNGLLDSTLVVATGEFGRTPLLNAAGGRDHWASAWTALVAGGGVQGGRVIGRTDSTGAEPIDRPVSPPELAATIFHALGISPRSCIPGPGGNAVEVYPARPVFELF